MQGEPRSKSGLQCNKHSCHRTCNTTKLTTELTL